MKETYNIKGIGVPAGIKSGDSGSFAYLCNQNKRADSQKYLLLKSNGKDKYKTYFLHASVSNVFLDISIAEYNHGDIIRTSQTSEWLFLKIPEKIIPGHGFFSDKVSFIYLLSILNFNLSVLSHFLWKLISLPFSLIS